MRNGWTRPLLQDVSRVVDLREIKLAHQIRCGGIPLAQTGQVEHRFCEFQDGGRVDVDMAYMRIAQVVRCIGIGTNYQQRGAKPKAETIYCQRCHMIVKELF